MPFGDDISLDVHGMEGIEAKLLQMGDVWSREAVHQALVPAGRILQGAITALAPVRTEDGRGGDALPPGKLKGDIVMEVFQKTVVVGPSRDTSHVAGWVEFGHALVRGGRRKKGGSVVGHVAPHPFIRPAFDTAIDPAAQAFVDSLAVQLEAVVPAEVMK
jgi:HK97 gp10 family phage protein